VPAAIRRASAADDAALAEMDRATWSSTNSPAPLWPTDRPFFRGADDPGDVLIAELDGLPVGYVKLAPATELASNRHVLEVHGLAVLPAFQRQRIGRRLIAAAVDEARARGARRVRLRVLATNQGAQRLYAAHGFEVVGVLREEFMIDGEYVDDVLMAIRVPGEPDGA
jgi:ribosomal protein S18 acetylase RimI-like enzyme